jgi:hypothetical protein
MKDDEERKEGRKEGTLPIGCVQSHELAAKAHHVL